MMSKIKRRRRAASEAAEIIDLGLNENAVRPAAAMAGEDPGPETAGRPRAALTAKIAAALRGRRGIAGLIMLLSLSALGGTLKYLEGDTQRQLAERQKATYLKPAQESMLSRLNPFLPTATATATPKLSKSYIYAGSRLLAVQDEGTSPAIPVDVAVWRSTNGTFYIMGPGSTIAASAGWGTGGDVPVPGDFDGDGKTDFAVFRPGNSTWYIIKSSDGGYLIQSFGNPGDIAVPADYDGDHKTDLAVYRPAPANVWYILRSSDSTLQIINYGAANITPVPADYDGDGKADAGIFYAPNSTFYVQRSSDGGAQQEQVSPTVTGGTPVAADYDGDGKADYAMRSGADWLIKPSLGGPVQTISWYSAADTAVQNDFDGDGKCDIAVWHGDVTGGGETEGFWYIRQSSQIGQPNELRTEGWGQVGDIPVPALWRR